VRGPTKWISPNRTAEIASAPERAKRSLRDPEDQAAEYDFLDHASRDRSRQGDGEIGECARSGDPIAAHQHQDANCAGEECRPEYQSCCQLDECARTPEFEQLALLDQADIGAVHQIRDCSGEQ